MLSEFLSIQTAPPPTIPSVLPSHQQQQQQQQQPQPPPPPQQQQATFVTPTPAYPQHFQQPPPQLVQGQATMGPAPPDYGTYEMPVSMTMEFRKGGEGPYVPRQQGVQDQGGAAAYSSRGADRRNQRPAQTFYQPPPRR